MNNQSGYKQQKRLALAQFLTESPSFAVLLVSAIFSRTILVFVDLLDSFGYLLRAAMVAILSGKLTKDLRYEYNYGVGKIEVISSLFCDGIVFFGLLTMLGLSVHSIIVPSKPSGMVIAVVGLKAINVVIDVGFWVKQKKILKIHHSAIAQTNCAAALAALLFDSITLCSLLAIFLFRNNPAGLYISPVMSIFIALYLIIGCVKRTRTALDELTDKTLPEESQMKILNVLARFYDSYAQLHTVNSHKNGELFQIDLYLSFEKNTSAEQIVNLKNQLQAEFDNQIGKCSVNIVVGGE